MIVLDSRNVYIIFSIAFMFFQAVIATGKENGFKDFIGNSTLDGEQNVTHRFLLRRGHFSIIRWNMTLAIETAIFGSDRWIGDEEHLEGYYTQSFVEEDERKFVLYEFVSENSYYESVLHYDIVTRKGSMPVRKEYDMYDTIYLSTSLGALIEFF